MNEIQKNIEAAFKMISSIKVAGDAVDVMAAARLSLHKADQLAGSKQDLWKAYKEAEKAEKKPERAECAQSAACTAEEARYDG